MAEYNDKYLTIADGKLTIRAYYFPIGTKKTIALSDVKSVQEHRMTGIMTGRGRIWGGSHKYWLNLDPGRPKKDWLYVLDLGKMTQPTVTPEDADAFKAALESSGLTIQPAAEE